MNSARMTYDDYNFYDYDDPDTGYDDELEAD